MVNYTVEYVPGEGYVRVPKPVRARRVVEIPAGCVRGSSWNVWAVPRKGAGSRTVEFKDTGRSSR